MDWLESLGKISADFAGKTLEFVHGDQPITLRGITAPLRRLSLQSLVTGQSAQDVEWIEILLQDPEKSATPAEGQIGFPAGLPEEVVAVLEKFCPVFDVPVGMPPRRPYDHRVHVLLGAKPVNERPYPTLTSRKMR